MELMTFFMLTLPISIVLWSMAIACGGIVIYSFWSVFR